MGHRTEAGYGIVVDAFSTGMRLAERLREGGWPLLHVRSSPGVPGFLTKSYDPSVFRAEVVHSDDLESTCARIAELADGALPRFVAVGTETGVELTDRLSARFGLPGNDPADSAARRDKVIMAERLYRAGLAAPATLRAHSEEQALAWAARRDRWPVVLKPAASAGNDRVFFCTDAVEVRRAFAQIHGRENRLGRKDEAVVVQAYLEGSQYIVNTTSLGGRHVVTDIWADHRRPMIGASNIYDYEDLLPARGQLEDALTSYVLRALDALGIRHGPAHSEVMMTEEGPVLIETAARLQGGLLEAPLLDALGRSQIAMSVACYTDPQRFDEMSAAPYQRSAHVRCVDLIAERSGIVRSVPGLALARSLPSFAGAVGWPTPGAKVERTVDLLSAPGIAYLCHPDCDQVERDYRYIRDLEARGELFDLHCETPMSGSDRSLPDISGPLVGPGDPDYDSARRHFNGACQSRPERIAYCTTQEDVAAIVRWARQNDKLLHLRSSGHCVAGHSGGDGVVLDLSRMTAVRLEGDVAHVGPATTFAALKDALRGTGWHLPMGLCDSVCVAGYTQGGGYGLTSRSFGMMCDRALGFSVLLADGSIVRTDAEQHPDLFWALRGAGGGHLGVVLDISLQMGRLADVWAFAMEWDRADIVAVLDMVQSRYCGDAVADELGYIMNLGFHAGRPAYCLQGLYCGAPEAGRALVAPLLQAGGGGTLVLDRAGEFAEMSVAAAEVPYEFPEELPDGFAYRKWGGYLTRRVPPRVWSELLALFERSPNAWSMVYLEPYGGVINRVPPLETAFVHRQALANLVVNIFWDSEPERRRVTAWLTEVQRLLSPWLSGYVYPNYRDPWLADHRHAYWGAAYPRLAEVKARYDPQRLLRSPQGI